MSVEKLTLEQVQGLTSIYQELCNSYRAIDDLRTKLLGILPVVSGAGVLLLFNDALSDTAKLEFLKQFLLPIGAFGFVITLGLFSYELHGIKKCGHLIHVGRQLERLLGIEGQFANRPGRVELLIPSLYVNEPVTARIIYSAVLAAWTFVALIFAWPHAAVWAALLIFSIGFYVPSRLNLHGHDPDAVQSRQVTRANDLIA